MPFAAPRPCLYPGCPAIQTAPRCQRHAAALAQQQRAKTGGYYSTPEWQRMRRTQLADEPYCRSCNTEGRITIATVADHITPLRHGGADLQSLCAHHHNVKRATSDKG